MHTININLHNLKTALIFSMVNISARLFISTWFTYMPNYTIFCRSAADDLGGGGWNPTSPGWDYYGQKTQLF